MTEKLLITPPGAARMLSCGRTMLYEMSADGRLGPEPVKFGRKVLYRVRELEDWVTAGCPCRNEWRKQRQGGTTR